MPQVISLHPHAKINLGLLIKGKLPNGYHTLETLLYPIFDIRDDLTIEKSEKSGCDFRLEGMKLDGDLSDNLCIRAYQALSEHVGGIQGVRISLTKKIPAGAGLGGGSSDAAFTLDGLNTLLDLGLSREELARLAAKLGADVPFFLYKKPMLATGIGTQLEEFEVDISHQIKVFPQPIHSSTVSAYKALDYTLFNHKRELKPILQKDHSHWKEELENDLEVPVFQLFPQLAEFKKKLYEEGAVYASMSGSGSAMFGIFKQ